jgi:hypothetical protein
MARHIDPIVHLPHAAMLLLFKQQLAERIMQTAAPGAVPNGCVMPH